MSNEDKIKIYLELINRIVSTKILDTNLIVAGGAATDILYGLVPNDIDIFLPRECANVLPATLTALFMRWGFDCLRADTQNVRLTDQKYGVNTLVYEITGIYRDQAIKLQFIAMENCHPSSSLSMIIQDYLFPTFGCSTSRSAFVTDGFNLYIETYKDNVALDNDGSMYIINMHYHDGAEKLVAKSLTKYIDFLVTYRKKEYPSFGYSTVRIDMRSLGKRVYRNSILAYLLGATEVTGVKTIDHKANTGQDTGTTKEYVPSMFSDNPTTRGGIRPRPQDWAGTSSPTQELQSTRVEDPWAVSQTWPPRRSLRPLIWTNEPVAREPVPVPPSGPSNNF